MRGVDHQIAVRKQEGLYRISQRRVIELDTGHRGCSPAGARDLMPASR